MAEVSKEALDRMGRAANRLHHLSMRYGGALAELAGGKALGMLPRDWPGLHEARDLIDLVLLCRAEINALTKCLCDAGALDPERYTRQAAEEYEWLCQQKARWLGVEVDDAGLVYRAGPG